MILNPRPKKAVLPDVQDIYGGEGGSTLRAATTTEINTDDLKPFVTYRNLQDDKIHLALQEAARRLRAQGKPLVLETQKNVK